MPTKTPTVPTEQTSQMIGDVSNAIKINRDQFPWGLPNTPPAVATLPTVGGLSISGATLQTRAPQFFQSGVTAAQMARLHQIVSERHSRMVNGMLETYLSRVRQSLGGPVSIGHNPDIGFVK